MEWKMKAISNELKINSNQPMDNKVTKLLSTMDVSSEFVNDMITLLNNPHYKYNLYENIMKFKDLDEASDLIIEYIKKNRNILVVTDYDSDGVNAAAMTYKFFKECIPSVNSNFCNYTVFVNSPKYGYGINNRILDFMKERYDDDSLGLVITMDHGITNEDMYKRIKEECPETKIIVTDHHEIQEDLYPTSADFVIDNKRKDNDIKMEASGCLMGFYLLLAVYIKLNPGYEKSISPCYREDDVFTELLPHLAISLLSDVISVDNIYNRIFIMLGLDVINKHKSIYPCWSTIKDLFKLPDEKVITEDDLVFKISPLLNLGKRAGESVLVFNLLTSKDRGEVLDIINKLNIYNTNRKNITEKLYKFTKETMSNSYKNSKVAVIMSEYNIGGSIASRLSEDNMGVPSICFNGNLENDELNGSGRLAIPDLDFMQMLKEVENMGNEMGVDIFVKYGGHKEAVGITIKTDSLDTFKKFLDIVASKYINENNLITCKYYNLEIEPSEIKDYGFIVSELSPYGKNHPKPIFKSRLEVVNIRKYNTYAMLEFKMGDETISGFYPKRNSMDTMKLNRFTRSPENDPYGGYENDFYFTISSYTKYDKEKDEYKCKYSLSILDFK